MTRTATVVLLDPEGEVLGRLPVLDLATPWWQETRDLVAMIQERDGLTVDVLRLVAANRPGPHGGAVTYLAQLRALPSVVPELEPVAPETAITGDEPQRAAFARPDGPARSLRWATGIIGPATAVQQRTWNLSAIWTLDTPAARFWLKQLPAWLPHEPTVLTWLGEVLPGLAPRLLALGPEGQELLADVPGDDLYDADLAGRLLILEQAHRFHTAALTAVDQLRAAGLPDRRGTGLADWIRSALGERPLPPAARSLLDGLDQRMAAVAACGVPATLVHGDLNPGNARIDGERVVILDWSECALDHPAFDLLRLAENGLTENGLTENGPDEDRPSGEAAVLVQAWADAWRGLVPGCDPLRALELLRPVAALRTAAVYADFVARIEPAERPYHAGDVEHLLASV